MRYFRTYWNQSSLEYATWIYSEVDNNGFETRKIELFLDGHYNYFDETTPFDLGEFLTDEEIQEVNKESEVHMLEIRREDFEQVLLYYLAK